MVTSDETSIQEICRQTKYLQEDMIRVKEVQIEIEETARVLRVQSVALAAMQERVVGRRQRILQVAKWINT